MTGLVLGSSSNDVVATPSLNALSSEDSEKQTILGFGDRVEQYVCLRGGSTPRLRRLIEQGGQVKIACGDIAYDAVTLED